MAGVCGAAVEGDAGMVLRLAEAGAGQQGLQLLGAWFRCSMQGRLPGLTGQRYSLPAASPAKSATPWCTHHHRSSDRHPVPPPSLAGQHFSPMPSLPLPAPLFHQHIHTHRTWYSSSERPECAYRPTSTRESTPRVTHSAAGPAGAGAVDVSKPVCVAARQRATHSGHGCHPRSLSAPVLPWQLHTHASRQKPPHTTGEEHAHTCDEDGVAGCGQRGGGRPLHLCQGARRRARLRASGQAARAVRSNGGN